MTYEGGNEQVATLIATLNKLNSLTGGNMVLAALTGSTTNYNLSLSGQYGGVYTPAAIAQGSGGGLNIANPSNLYSLSHELFYVYQHENMDLVNSTTFEVEANLFESHIYYQVTGIVPLLFEEGSTEFVNAYINLLFNENFSQQQFDVATRTFLIISFHPPKLPTYDQLRPIIIQNPIIIRF